MNWPQQKVPPTHQLNHRNAVLKSRLLADLKKNVPRKNIGQIQSVFDPLLYSTLRQSCTKLMWNLVSFWFFAIFWHANGNLSTVSIKLIHSSASLKWLQIRNGMSTELFQGMLFNTRQSVGDNVKFNCWPTSIWRQSVISYGICIIITLTLRHSKLQRGRWLWWKWWIVRGSRVFTRSAMLGT